MICREHFYNITLQKFPNSKTGHLPRLADAQFLPSRIHTVTLDFLSNFRQYVPSQRFLFDRSSIAKLKISHSVNVVCDGSPSRMRSVRRISLGMTILPRSSDCVNQVQNFFMKPRKALKYKGFSAFGASNTCPTH